MTPSPLLQRAQAAAFRKCRRISDSAWQLHCIDSAIGAVMFIKRAKRIAGCLGYDSCQVATQCRGQRSFWAWCLHERSLIFVAQSSSILHKDWVFAVSEADTVVGKAPRLRSWRLLEWPTAEISMQTCLPNSRAVRGASVDLRRCLGGRHHLGEALSATRRSPIPRLRAASAPIRPCDCQRPPALSQPLVDTRLSQSEATPVHAARSQRSARSRCAVFPTRGRCSLAISGVARPQVAFFLEAFRRQYFAELDTFSHRFLRGPSEMPEASTIQRRSARLKCSWRPCEGSTVRLLQLHGHAGFQVCALSNQGRPRSRRVVPRSLCRTCRPKRQRQTEGFDLSPRQAPFSASATSLCQCCPCFGAGGQIPHVACIYGTLAPITKWVARWSLQACHANAVVQLASAAGSFQATSPHHSA